MSMFVCMPEHIGLLAAALVQYKHTTKDVEDLAAMLVCENIASAKARYPHDEDGDRPGPHLYDEQVVGAAMMYAAHYHKYFPEWMDEATGSSLARCYSYQACEHDEWAQSEAMMINSRLEVLPDTDSRVRWEFIADVLLPEVEALFDAFKRS